MSAGFANPVMIQIGGFLRREWSKGFLDSDVAPILAR